MDIMYGAIFIFSLGYVLNIIMKMKRRNSYLFTMCVSADKKGKDILLGYAIESVEISWPYPVKFVFDKFKKEMREKFIVEGEYDEVFFDFKHHRVEQGEWVIDAQ